MWLLSSLLVKMLGRAQSSPAAPSCKYLGSPLDAGPETQNVKRINRLAAAAAAAAELDKVCARRGGRGEGRPGFKLGTMGAV